MYSLVIPCLIRSPFNECRHWLPAIQLSMQLWFVYDLYPDLSTIKLVLEGFFSAFNVTQLILHVLSRH